MTITVYEEKKNPVEHYTYVKDGKYKRPYSDTWRYTFVYCDVMGCISDGKKYNGLCKSHHDMYHEGIELDIEDMSDNGQPHEMSKIYDDLYRDMYKDEPYLL